MLPSERSGFLIQRNRDVLRRDRARAIVEPTLRVIGKDAGLPVNAGVSGPRPQALDPQWFSVGFSKTQARNCPAAIAPKSGAGVVVILRPRMP